MANDISHAQPLFYPENGWTRATFRELLTSSAAARKLPSAVLIDKDRNVLESAQTGIQLAFAPPPPEILSSVGDTEPEISVIPEQNYVAAVIRLQAFTDTFLYVARPLDPEVVAQLTQTEASAIEYARLESQRLGIQVAFALMFAVIALTILMASVLIGLNFANWLVAPIRNLMSAANIVSTGDLHVQVPVHKSEGDLAQLGQTFNKMTQELRTQRDELVSDRQPPPFHRGGTVVGQRRHHRRRRLRQRRHPEPLGRKTHWPRRIRNAGSSALGCVARTRRHDEDRARGDAAAGAGPDHHHPRRP
jgi:two-component system nitrogen regulation sensor histidine kinase NtrY